MKKIKFKHSEKCLAKAMGVTLDEITREKEELILETCPLTLKNGKREDPRETWTSQRSKLSEKIQEKLSPEGILLLATNFFLLELEARADMYDLISEDAEDRYAIGKKLLEEIASAEESSTISVSPSLVEFIKLNVETAKQELGISTDSEYDKDFIQEVLEEITSKK